MALKQRHKLWHSCHQPSAGGDPEKGEGLRKGSCERALPPPLWWGYRAIKVKNLPLLEGYHIEQHETTVNMMTKLTWLEEAIYITILGLQPRDRVEFSFQRRERHLFLTTNMAIITSCINQQYLRLCGLPCCESPHHEERGKPAIFWTINILDFRQLEIDLISFDKAPGFWFKDVVNFPHLEGKMIFQIPLWVPIQSCICPGSPQGMADDRCIRDWMKWWWVI